MIFQAAVVNGREVYFCKPDSKAETMIYDTDSSFAVCGYWGNPEKELFSQKAGDAFSGCKISAFAENGILFADCYGKQNEIAWRICREELK